MGRISRLALTPWHDYILQSSPGSRFPILKQTPHSIAFRRPGGEVIAHFLACGPIGLGPGTFADFVANNDHGIIQGANATYATARATSTATFSTLSIGQYHATGLYYVRRGFIRFPTQVIGTDATVTGASQTLTCVADASTAADFDVQIVKAAWTGTVASPRETNYDLALSAALDDSIWRNTAGMSVDTPYTSGALAVAWVNKTAVTPYAYRSSRDSSATAPGANTQEQIQLYEYNAATVAYRPTLNLTYDLWEYTTQVTVEVDLLNSAPERRTTQVLVEADFDGSDVERRFSQELAEVDLDADTTRQFSQVLLEVDADAPWVPIERRVSQHVLEADVNADATRKVSQHVTEVDVQADTERRVSQHVLEVDGEWVLGVERQISQHVLEVDVSQRSRYVTQTGVEVEAEEPTPGRAASQIGVEAEIDLPSTDSERRVSQIGIEWDTDKDAQRRTTSVGIEVEVEFREPIVPIAPPDPHTHVESIHLPISLWQPRWIAGAYAPKDHYLETLLEVEGYVHSLSALGGFWESTWSIKAGQGALDEWIDEGLGRHVEVHDEAQVLVWEGFVNEIEASLGPLTVRRGPLLDVANQVWVRYTDLATGTDALIGPYDDASSQAVYGILPIILQGGEMSTDGGANEPLQLANSYLIDNAWPKTEKELSTGSSELSLQVSCVGYVRRLNYPYINAGAGTQDLSTKIANILDADPNGLFSSANSGIVVNTVQVPVEEQRCQDAWSILQQQVALGDASYSAYSFIVGAGRRVEYQPLPVDVAYRHRLSDPAQRIETPSGTEVRPWCVQPAKWIMHSDLLIGRVPPGVPVQKDPRAAMLQQVTYTAPWSLQYTEQRVGRTSQLIQQLALAGGAW